MTIEVYDAAVARSAVDSHVLLDKLAYGANSLRVNLFEQSQQIGRIRIDPLKVAWLRLRSHHEACHSHEARRCQHVLEQRRFDVWEYKDDLREHQSCNCNE